MCGIFGYVGARTDAPGLVLHGLKQLEYRGYDSWGIAVPHDGAIVLEKRTGKIGQAKNGMMGGMWPTSMTMKAYADSKTEAPKTLSDANALFAKAAAVSTSLAKYSLKLDAPKPVDTGAPAKKKTE